jgi:phosphoglycolate phosphatase-like HAD superfamily hydrolase
MLSDYKDVFERIAVKRYRLVCLDFGGTLVDFTPLHVRGFLEALGLERSEGKSQIVADTVRLQALRGVDSYMMMKAIARSLNLIDEVYLESLVIKKRRLVEGFLQEVRLPDEACWFIDSITKFSKMAVISLGLCRSMESVLSRSLGIAAERIHVYGRRSFDERVDKQELVCRAIRESGISKDLAVYVGDAAVDEEVAQKIGMDAIQLRPFLGPQTNIS